MFKLRVRLSDGFEFDLDEHYARQFEANRAAANYIRDYRDPCGVGARVEYISTIDLEAIEVEVKGPERNIVFVR